VRLRQCQTASVLVRALAAGATGPSVFNCTTTPDDTNLFHACVLEIPEFLVQRTPLNCTTGQCVDTIALNGGDGVLSNETLTTALDFSGEPVNASLNACIAAIPTIVAIVLASAILIYFWAFVASLYRDAVANDGISEVNGVDHADSKPVTKDRFEFSVSAKSHLSSYALQRRIGNVRGKTRLSFPGNGGKGDVEFGSSEAQSSVARLHLKDGEPNQWYILDSCVGVASSGNVTGILGPSGCGKTTLLSTLSGAAHSSLRSLHVTGKVTWNGKPVRRGASIAFVPQMDALIPTMTVHEQLLFAGRLKNPNMDAEAVRMKAQGILRELGIDEIADQYVGGTSTLRGISGGERRRVMIGTALVSSPRMIVLDEPLSGLDSYNALIVTQTLKSLANRGRIVLYSLHQPSDDIYMSLDEAIFMAHGRIVYRGPPGDCRELLTGAGIDPCISKRSNLLADTMLYALNDPSTCEKLIEGGVQGVDGDEEDVDTVADDTSDTSISHSSSFRHDAPSLCLQTSTVFYRTLTDVWRNKSLLLLHVCIAVVAGLLAGGLFYDLGYDTQGVQGRYGGIFVSLCFLAFTSLTTVDLFIAERDVVTAEVNSGLYRGWVYVMCKLVVDGLLLRALPAAIYAVPVRLTRITLQNPQSSHLLRFLRLQCSFTGWQTSVRLHQTGSRSCSP
jgi:ABC-type multidrug transport system ATPase subunit